MKIKHYPGKAVDASLSLEGSSAMGALYEANWLRAATQAQTQPQVQTQSPYPTLTRSPSKLSRQSSSAGSGSSFLLEGISALSKYQIALENIRQLEQQSQQSREKCIVSTIKELNGYRPSAMQHHHQPPHNGWVSEEQDDSHEIKGLQEEEKKKETTTTTPAVNHYVLDPTERARLPRPRQQLSVKPPSLRRSQTMMMQQPPPSYATLRSSPSKVFHRSQKNLSHSGSSATYSTFSSAADDGQDQIVICQQPQRLMSPPPPREPPPAPPKRVVTKPLTRSQTSVQRYATIRLPNGQSTSFSRSIARPRDSTSSLRRHSLEQALKGLKLEEEEAVGSQEKKRSPPLSERISPAASSNGSSKDLNGEGFCIPRPRLIVPVHTYARRRRTGNLKEQSSGGQEEEEAESSKGKGLGGYLSGDSLWI